MNNLPDKDSLQRQLAEARENLGVIQERMAQFVLSTDVPLQLAKEERHWLDRIAELEQQLAAQPAEAGMESAPEQPPKTRKPHERTGCTLRYGALQLAVVVSALLVFGISTAVVIGTRLYTGAQLDQGAINATQTALAVAMATEGVDTPTPLPTATLTPEPPTVTPEPTATLTPTPTLAIGSTRVREKDGIVMVYVPAGEFAMGSTDAQVEAAWQGCKTGTSKCERVWFERELPQHRVAVDGFWIDRTEVTNAQYARCVAAGVCRPPTLSSSSTRQSYYGDSQFDEYPVTQVSWYDARDFCAWVGGRLPTEAEWEYAARGPDGHIYPWGNEPPDDTLLNYNNNVGDTTQVGSYPKGQSWAGALDMAGSVWEWVNDWIGGYRPEPQVNPSGPPSGASRAMHGGCWNNDPARVRAAYRSYSPPDSRNPIIGFRCVVAPGK